MSFLDLDRNATTPPYPAVVECVARHLRDTPGNPGSRHAAGRRARRVLEDARESLADGLGAEPEEIVFTSGGTEAANLALAGLIRGPRLGEEAADSGPTTVLVTPGEHPAVAAPLAAGAAAGRWRVRRWPLDENGLLKGDELENPPPGLRLVSLIHAHNETGAILDVAPVLVRCNRLGVPSHLDATQAVGKLPWAFRSLGATAASLGAHKFRGPRGIGALLIRSGAKLAPSLHGGHQEGGRRPGTEPVALAAGMALALELRMKELDDWTTHTTALRDRLEAALRRDCSAVIHAAGAPRLPNTASVAFPGCGGEELLVALDLAGVGASLGSACASGSSEPSPVLIAMGLPPELLNSSLRFSLLGEEPPEQIDEAAARIAACVKRVQEPCEPRHTPKIG
ncbi:cysteine desulfurase family protein [Alienimonas californiensis]|uniref:Cysteine desulfurase n=1 Tax=Alienimonas californiensis TaxID=2527989 RepID=A0A517P697_9PLAN|nr:cysteine desulfurase family protein [Alienimonas californiensis]QDT14894.1 Cysteine desulfurase [Alienimonas californiensis]